MVERVYSLKKKNMAIYRHGMMSDSCFNERYENRRVLHITLVTRIVAPALLGCCLQQRDP
jgi:hypothetical protein